MKSSKLFIKIYLSLIIISFISIIILYILGMKVRIGYFSGLNLNIDKTLELNGLNISEIKNLFIKDDKLDNDSFTNYIFTNEIIKNYSYGFRIKYYSKIFINSDIYSVYIDTNKVIQDNNFIKEIEMDGNGSPFGNLISSKIINFEKINNVNYYLKVKSFFFFYLIINIIFILIILNNIKYKNIMISNNKNSILYDFYLKYNNFFTEKKFIIFIIVIGLILFSFHLWIGFPGYFHNPDNIVILKQSVLKNYSNWHPVIIAATLNFLYKLFGQHTFYITLINLICLYLGLVLVTISLYLKLKNKNIILIYFITFIPNFYFTSISQLKDVTASMYLWLAGCIIFFMILVPIKKIIFKVFIYIFLSFILILSLLWRHNMIVSIYPIILFLIFLIVYKLNIRNKIKNIFIYLSTSLLCALVLILILKITPYIFIKSQTGYYENVNIDELYNKYGYIIDYLVWMDINDNFSRNAANNIFLIQIASCAVQNNDDSLIPSNWYEKGKNFEDLKKLYSIDKYDADSYGAKWRNERIFNSLYLKDLSKVWISYIIKYPYSYIKFLSLYFYKWLSSNIGYIVTAPNYIPEVLKDIGFKTYSVPFNNLRNKLIAFLYSTLDVPILLLFIISVIIFLSSISILIKYKPQNYTLLLFSFFLSFSSLATFFIVVIFSFIDGRYMYPMFVTSILSLISFSLFLYERIKLKKL